MALVVVGPVKPAEVAPLIAAAFGDMKDRAPARPEPDLGQVSMPASVSAQLHGDPELSRLTLSIQTTEPYAFEPDTAANRLKYLPRQLAYAMLDRRFQELAKKPGAPFTSASTGTSEFLDFVRNSTVEVVTTKAEQWKSSLAVAEQELRRALTHGFQAAELREVTANLANDLEEEVKQAATRRSPELCAELLDTIAHDNVFDLPSTRRDLLKPALATITPAECLAALRDTWKAPGRLIFVSGNLALTSPEADIVAAYKESAGVPVTAPAQIEESKWGYSTSHGSANRVRVTGFDDLDIQQMEFENGVVLTLKKTSFEAATIHISARLGGGLLTLPADKPGLNVYASIAAGQMGLGKHSADDLRRILAGRSVSGGLGIANDAFTLSGRTTPQDLELELQYLAAWASDPGFRPEAESLIAGQLTQHYQQLTHSPDGVLQLETFRRLASGDPRLGLPPLETISRYTMADVRAWLAPQLGVGPLELSIVGDIDIDTTIELVAKTFGTLPQRTAKPDYAQQSKVVFPAAGFAVERTVPTQIPRGVVFACWPTGDMWDISRTRRLNLLADVIDDRLRVKIREGLGGAYSPSAQSTCSDTFTGYGYLLVYAGVEPAQAPAILAAVREIAESLRTHGVTDDELERAKQPVLTSIIESERKNGYWLGAVLSSCAEFPQRLDWARNRRADIAAVTPAELSALAAQYLLPERAVSYVILPEALPDNPPALPAKPILPAATK
jgi:zinc protease